MNRKLGKVITVACHKGGVGKTTFSFNIAGILAERGFKVVAIDADGQCNLTQSAVVVNGTKLLGGGLNVWKMVTEANADVKDLIIKGPHFDVIAGFDREDEDDKALDPIKANGLFSKAIDDLRLMYDYIIIDTPPSTGIMTKLPILASSAVIMPMQFELYGISGTRKVLRIVEEFHDIGLRPNKNIWVVPSLTTGNFNLHSWVEGALEEEGNLKRHIIDIDIRRGTAAGQAAAVGVPLIKYAKGSAVTKDFVKLVDFIETLDI